MNYKFRALVTRKIAASSVNCGLTFIAVSPFMQLTPNYWRYVAVVVFFSLQQINRCPGMLVTGQHWHIKPESSLYSLLYTISFSTLLWYIWFPLDVALANGSLQLACLYLTGNTVHEYMTGVKVMTKDEQTMDAIMNGCCPDCASKNSLRPTGFANDFECVECKSRYVCDLGIPYKLNSSNRSINVT